MQIANCKKQIPGNKYVLGNGMNQLAFESEQFTLVSILDFTIYTIKDESVIA